MPKCISGTECNETQNCYCRNCKAYAAQLPRIKVYGHTYYYELKADGTLRRLGCEGRYALTDWRFIGLDDRTLNEIETQIAERR